MTQSENENDHFDLDHFDHIFATPFILPCSSYAALMLLLFEMGDKSVPPPLQVRCKSVPKNGRERGLGKEEHRRYVHIKNSYLR